MEVKILLITVYKKKLNLHSLYCIDDPSPTTTTTLPGPPTINPSVSNTRNACSGGAKLTHFHMANSDSSNANAYFLAQ